MATNANRVDGSLLYATIKQGGKPAPLFAPRFAPRFELVKSYQLGATDGLFNIQTDVVLHLTELTSQSFQGFEDRI